MMNSATGWVRFALKLRSVDEIPIAHHKILFDQLIFDSDLLMVDLGTSKSSP